MKHAFLATAIASFLLTSCNEETNVFLPPTKCTTAIQCVQDMVTTVPECGRVIGASDRAIKDETFGSVSGELRDKYHTLHNFHDSRDIAAVVTLIITSQGGSQTTQIQPPYITKANPKISPAIPPGHMNWTGSAGPGRGLGCEYVKAANSTIDHYRWKIESACFLDDPNCPPPGAPPVALSPRPPVTTELARCEAACKTSDAKRCLMATVPKTVAVELREIYQQMSVRSLPTAFPFYPVLNALGASRCTNHQMFISPSRSTNAYGSACVSTWKLDSGETVAFEAPGTITGPLTRGAAPYQSGAIQFDQKAAPVVYYLDAAMKPTSSDPILALQISSSALLIAGENRFCARLSYE